MGLFVTFEGPEGGGKTTHMNLLAAYLRGKGQDVLLTREPGGTPIGDRVRAVVLDPGSAEMLPMAEFLLISGARAQHVGQIIRPCLARGGVVLCDRFADSSLAYQGYGLQQDLEALRLITLYATGGLVPDLTICLDLPVELGLRRKTGGTGDAWNLMERRGIEFHERVRAGYLVMAAQDPARWEVIDASHPVEEVQAVVRTLVLTRQAEMVRWKGGTE